MFSTILTLVATIIFAVCMMNIIKLYKRQEDAKKKKIIKKRTVFIAVVTAASVVLFILSLLGLF